MSETVFLKLGGSLITEKTRQETPRRQVLARVAGEIAAARRARPGLRLVLGHGSGSYGHFAAARYGVHRGCLADWWGYAETSAAAARLDRLVVDACLEAGVPAVAVQPSASARTRGGELVDLTTWPLEEMLARGLVPTVYGDVALDETQGCSIVSTEAICACLARRLRPGRILLAGEVDGIYTADPHRDPSARPLPCLTVAAWRAVEERLAGAHGFDVTGGMRAKVQQMLALAAALPGLQVWVFSGLDAGRVQRALEGEPGGTLLVAEAGPCQRVASGL